MFFKIHRILFRTANARKLVDIGQDSSVLSEDCNERSSHTANMLCRITSLLSFNGQKFLRTAGVVGTSEKRYRQLTKRGVSGTRPTIVRTLRDRAYPNQF